MKQSRNQLYAAIFLTFGLGVCIAALAAGHADDPRAGLLGFAIFFGCAFAAFRCASIQGSK